MVSLPCSSWVWELLCLHLFLAMFPHIDMGGYKGKVRKISGKVHFFLDVSSEMLFEGCRICGFFWSTCIPIVFSCHSLGVPLPFVLCLSKSLLGSCFHFMPLEWDDTSCDVVANGGRYHRWSPPRDYDFSKMCLLACVYARAHQQFCTFCFHNLHTLPLFCHRLSMETRELRQKTWEIFWKISHVFQIISHVFFFCSDFLQHRFFFHENLLFRAVPALAVFLAFCALFFYIFSPCSAQL